MKPVNRGFCFPGAFGFSKRSPPRLQRIEMRSAAPFCKASMILVVAPQSCASSPTWGHSHFIPQLLVDSFFLSRFPHPLPGSLPHLFLYLHPWHVLWAGNSGANHSFCAEKECAECCPGSDCALIAERAFGADTRLLGLELGRKMGSSL